MLHAGSLTPCIPLHLVGCHLFIEAFRGLIKPLAQHGDTRVSIKLYARPLWEGNLPGGLSGESLMAIIHSVCIWFADKLRVLRRGKQFDWRDPAKPFPCQAQPALANLGVVHLRETRPITGIRSKTLLLPSCLKKGMNCNGFRHRSVP